MHSPQRCTYAAASFLNFDRPWLIVVLVLWFTASLNLSLATARERPAPPPSRYSYDLELDVKSLPKGVTARKVITGGMTRWFLKNESDVPLVIQERYQGDRLVGGIMLVGGKVYGYFPNGIPMEGKEHLKGWQAPFGDIEEALLTLPSEPAGIALGREPGASDTPPEPEAVEIAAQWDGKPYVIKGTVHYRLNDADPKQKDTEKRK